MIKKAALLIFLLVMLFKTEVCASVLNVADSILQTGDYKKALIILRKAQNQSIKINEKIADIYQKTGNYSKAIEYYKRVYDKTPTDNLKEKLGLSYQYIGNTNKAISFQEDVIKNNPQNLLLTYNLAKLYMAENKNNKAIALLKGLLEVDPSNPNYYFKMGEVQDKLKKDPSKNYLKAILLDSLHIRSMYNLAKFYNTIKVRDSADIFIDKGLAINSNNINFLQLKAQNEFLEKQYDTTLVYLKKLEDQNFKTLFVYKLFGLSYFKLNDYENALKYFTKAKQLDFTDASILFNLGLVYKELKDYKNAQMHFLISIMLQKPTYDENYYQLGLIQVELKQLKKAIISFQEGYKNNNKNHLLLFQLALTSDNYYKDKKIALNYYKEYLEKFKDNDKSTTNFAQQRIKEINKELFVKGEKVD